MDVDELQEIREQAKAQCKTCEGSGYTGYYCHGEWHEYTCGDCGPKYSQAELDYLIEVAVKLAIKMVRK